MMIGANWARIAKPLSMVAVLSMAALSPGKALSDNIVDALMGAYNTSGLLEQNRAVLRAADEGVAVAVSTLRPVIDFSLSASRDYANPKTTVTSNTTTVSAQLLANWLLWDGGARRLDVESKKETVLATRQTLRDIEQRILLSAVRAYVDVILQNENVRLRRNNLRVLGEELRAAQDRFEVGEVTRTDVALAESRVAAARSNLAEAQGDLVNAQAAYQNAVGHAPGQLAGQPRLPARPASIDAATAVAMRNHPQLLAAQHQVKAADLAVQKARKDLGPTLNAQARLTVSDNLEVGNRNSDNGALSLTLNQRLYQGGARNSLVRSAISIRDQRRGNLLAVQGDIRQDVSDSYIALQVAVASLAATAERVRAAQVAFDGIREEATLGARTTLDVLSAEQELLNALTSQVSARSAQSIAAYQLLAAQGLLTAEHLGLKVKIYDPALYYNLAKKAPHTRSKQSRDLDRVLKALGKN